jgi:hypothetical protein
MSKSHLSAEPYNCLAVTSYCNTIHLNNFISSNFNYSSKTNGGHDFDY